MMDDSQLSAKKDLDNVEQSLIEVQDQIESLLNKQSALQKKRAFLKQHIQLLAEQQKSSHDWSSEDFEWSAEVKEKCFSIFGIQTFRANQLETINTTMSGLDCILIMPTGAGKSLCYQLPAVVSTGITLVISPLVSLMEDQLIALEKREVSAVMLNASSSKEQVNSVYADMVTKKPNLRLLYVTPEKLAKSKRFMNKLEQCYKVGSLVRIAIDEVHCCSQWGHDFRPDYKFLGILKKQYPKVPILGLTATASTHVLADVQKLLQLSHSQVFKGSFNRQNLHYSVISKPAKHDECMKKLHSVIHTNFPGQTGIVYCFSRKDTVTVAADLNSKGIVSSSYHAYLDPNERRKIHHLWYSNKIQVIVATIAFGMGIDKANVRFVIHHSLSKSMENYYQESGRAGRDGLRADCILLYRLADVYRQSCMVFTESTGLDKLYGMVEYCNNQDTCRRKLIAQHFSEVWKETGCDSMCDHCCDGSAGDRSADLALPTNVSADMQLVYEILDKAVQKDSRLTGQMVLEAMIGKGSCQNRGKTSSCLSQGQCELLIAMMLTNGCIKEDFHFTPYSTISYLVLANRCSSITSLRKASSPENSPQRASSQEKVKRKVRKRKVTADNGDSSASKSTGIIVLSD